MLREIGQHKAEMQALCRRLGVKRLDLFGSAVRDSGPGRLGDLDFLVDLGDRSPEDYAETYFSLKEALEELFSRPVDLVTVPSIRNPFFKQRLEETRSVLYAA